MLWSSCNRYITGKKGKQIFRSSDKVQQAEFFSWREQKKSYGASQVYVFMLLFFREPAPFPVDNLCQLSALHSSTAFPSSDLWENLLWPVIDSALPAPLLSIAVKLPMICRKPVSTALFTLSFRLPPAHTTCIRITASVAFTSCFDSFSTHIFLCSFLLR